MDRRRVGDGWRTVPDPRRDPGPPPPTHWVAVVSHIGFPTEEIRVPVGTPDPTAWARKAYLDKHGLWSVPVPPEVVWRG